MDLTVIYPKPYSIYLSGTIGVLKMSFISGLFFLLVVSRELERYLKLP